MLQIYAVSKEKSIKTIATSMCGGQKQEESEELVFGSVLKHLLTATSYVGNRLPTKSRLKQFFSDVHSGPRDEKT